MSSSDDGLNTKIKAVMEPMINALLITTPENPVFFMIQWLKTFNNANPSFLDKEREEFEKLKYELETYQRAKIEIPKSTNLLDFSERKDDESGSESFNNSVKKSNKQNSEILKNELSKKNEEDNESENEEEKN
jgi:hypothetical protein